MNILQKFTNELHHSLNVRLKTLLDEHSISPIDHIELSRLAVVERMHRYMRNLSNVTAEKHENDDQLASFDTNYPAIASLLQDALDNTNGGVYAGEMFTNWVMDSHNNINDVTDPFEPFSLLDRFNAYVQNYIDNCEPNEDSDHIETDANTDFDSGEDYIDSVLKELD